MQGEKQQQRNTSFDTGIFFFFLRGGGGGGILHMGTCPTEILTSDIFYFRGCSLKGLSARGGSRILKREGVLIVCKYYSGRTLINPQRACARGLQ